MEDALKLIISKTSNQHVAGEALTCLQAIRAKSPIVQIRYQRVLQMALSNDDWTPAERAVLAVPLEVADTENRGFMLRIRLTDSEHITLQESADAANLSMSEYARRKLFGHSDA